MRDVALRAGVSTATVSNVLSGRRPVGKALHQRVLEAAAALDYQPDRLAAQLRLGQSRVVGVLVPDLADVFFTGLVSRLEVMARHDGHDVILASSRDDPQLERSRLRALLGWRPAGLVAVPCTDRLPDELRAACDEVPVVLVDRLLPGAAPADAVCIDNAAAGALVARHLIERGYRELTVAASDLGISPIRERLRGVREQTQAQGLPPPRVVELGSQAEAGTEAFLRWLGSGPPPAAVFALTNVTTLAVLGGLARAHIPVPEGCALVGFDDYPWMSARTTPLSAIAQPLDEIAAATWGLLTRRMAGESGPPQRMVLQAGLRARDSVGRLPRAAVTALDTNTASHALPRQSEVAVREAEAVSATAEAGAAKAPLQGGGSGADALTVGSTLSRKPEAPVVAAEIVRANAEAGAVATLQQVVASSAGAAPTVPQPLSGTEAPTEASPGVPS